MKEFFDINRQDENTIVDLSKRSRRAGKVMFLVTVILAGLIYLLASSTREEELLFLLLFPGILLIISLVLMALKNRLTVNHITGEVKLPGRKGAVLLLKRAAALTLYEDIEVYYNKGQRNETLVFKIGLLEDDVSGEAAAVLEKSRIEIDTLLKEKALEIGEEQADVLKRHFDEVRPYMERPVYHVFKDYKFLNAWRLAESLGKLLNLPVIDTTENKFDLRTPSEFDLPLGVRMYLKKDLPPEEGPKPPAVMLAETHRNLTITWKQKNNGSFLLLMGIALFMLVIPIITMGGDIGYDLLPVIIMFSGFGPIIIVFTVLGVFSLRGHGKNEISISEDSLKFKTYIPWQKEKEISLKELEYLGYSLSTIHLKKHKRLVALSDNEEMFMLIDTELAPYIQRKILGFVYGRPRW